MINRVVLVGRMTKDPELRRTNSGLSVASFTLALDNRSKGPNGEKTTSFIPCQVWDKQADNVSRFTRKGSLVGVEGRLNQRTYEAKDGRRVSTIEVICDSVQFLERKSDAQPAADQGYNPDVANDYQPDVEPQNKNVSSIDVADDDLPF